MGRRNAVDSFSLAVGSVDWGEFWYMTAIPNSNEGFLGNFDPRNLGFGFCVNPRAWNARPYRIIILWVAIPSGLTIMDRFFP
jgi:hypothetical protein